MNKFKRKGMRQNKNLINVRSLCFVSNENLNVILKSFLDEHWRDTEYILCIHITWT